MAQSQAHEEIAPRYEALAKVVSAVVAALDHLGLPSTDADGARAEARGLVAEMAKAEPDRGVVKRGVTMLNGLLASALTGTNQAFAAESTERVRSLIAQLVSAVPN